MKSLTENVMKEMFFAAMSPQVRELIPSLSGEVEPSGEVWANTFLAEYNPSWNNGDVVIWPHDRAYARECFSVRQVAKDKLALILGLETDSDGVIRDLYTIATLDNEFNLEVIGNIPSQGYWA